MSRDHPEPTCTRKRARDHETLRSSRSIHLAHAAFADLGGDGVGAEGGAGGEGHQLSRSMDESASPSLQLRPRVPKTFPRRSQRRRGLPTHLRQQ